MAESSSSSSSPLPPPPPPSPARRFKIGYALAPKKITSFIKPSLIHQTSLSGIDLISIDPNQSLLTQGPFDCLIHKLHSNDWTDQLLRFANANPSVPIVDHPYAIDRLHNRVTMLQVVPELGVESVGIPKQIFVDLDVDFSVVEDLRFPVIGKPLVADGAVNSHDMLLVFNRQGLEKLKPPVVLQEFVNHGGVIFKIYVVGQHVECVVRRSLPDISEEKVKTAGDAVSFSQISNLNAANYGGRYDGFLEATDLGSVEMPPSSFVTDLALKLQQALGLNLFNFDVIRDGERYLVIDINYFPGFAKMPNYEPVLTQFFWDIVHKNPNVLLSKPNP